MTARKTSRRGGRSIGRFLRRLTLVVVIMVLGVGGWVWWSSGLDPTWWAPSDPESPAVRDLADQVELGVLEKTHQIRPADEPWGVRITEEEVNAWLAAKLQAWLKHEGDLEWPQKIGTPQVNFEAGGISLGVELQEGETQRVLVVHLVPRVSAGGLRLELAGITIGRLPLPGGVEGLPQLLALSGGDFEAGDLDDLLDILEGRTIIDSSVVLSDDRIVRLQDIQFVEGELLLTCRTLPPGGDDGE